MLAAVIPALIGEGLKPLTIRSMPRESPSELDLLGHVALVWFGR